LHVVDYHFVAFTRQAKLTNASWDTLASFSIGYLRGWKIYERSLKPETKATVVDTPEQLFSILDKDRIDVARYERSLRLALINKLEIKNIHVVEPALTELAKSPGHATTFGPLRAAYRADSTRRRHTPCPPRTRNWIRILNAFNAMLMNI
jgi:hypothetical protein